MSIINETQTECNPEAEGHGRLKIMYERLQNTRRARTAAERADLTPLQTAQAKLALDCLPLTLNRDGYRTLTDRAGLSRREAQRLFDTLAEQGFVEIITRNGTLELTLKYGA